MRRTRISSPRATQPGFSLIEAIIVMVVLAILGAMALPSIARSMTTNRVDRAALTVAGDIEAAFSLAARSRKPIDLVVDSINMRMVIRDRATATVLQTRSYSLTESDFGLTRLAPSVSSITIFPNGLASSPFVIYAFASRSARAVRVRRTGQIRITMP
jgi:prepilin-type N-terminal cleavage/methylation domain-containing protein